MKYSLEQIHHWIDKQRQEYRRNNLSEYKINYLEQSGFKWKAHNFVSIDKALKFSISLGFTKVREWMEYTKTNELPEKIPIAPNVVYENCGWVNWRHFLTGNTGFFKDHPLFSEIHPSKNKNINFDTIEVGSKIKIWFIGKCGHEYRTRICYRTKQGTGCPVCIREHASQRRTEKCKHSAEWRSKKKISSCERIYPKTSKMWNYEKNGKFTPMDIMAGTNKKFWCILPNDKGSHRSKTKRFCSPRDIAKHYE